MMLLPEAIQEKLAKLPEIRMGVQYRVLKFEDRSEYPTFIYDNRWVHWHPQKNVVDVK